MDFKLLISKDIIENHVNPITWLHTSVVVSVSSAGQHGHFVGSHFGHDDLWFPEVDDVTEYLGSACAACVLVGDFIFSREEGDLGSR